MEYIVRPFRPSDESFVWAEHLKANQSYMERHMGASVELIRQYFDRYFPLQACYMIESDGGVIGCYCLNDEGDAVKLSRFFLVDFVQGKDLGTKIVQQIIHEKPENKKLFVLVWTDNPVAAFWQKMGFVHETTGEDNLMKMVYTEQ